MGGDSVAGSKVSRETLVVSFVISFVVSFVDKVYDKAYDKVVLDQAMSATNKKCQTEVRM
jgi:hypothetical protein